MVSSEQEAEKKISVNTESLAPNPAPAYDATPGEVHDVESHNVLKRDLKGRHMQMIAIGGAIGAGLFVGTGGALHAGGPGSLLIGYLVIGLMLLLTIHALGELAVLYPENGAFFTYCVRFINPAWGFAVGWDYAISWLVILPFEITAAGITIQYWRDDLNIGIWIAVFLTVLSAIQIFGVKGYGEGVFASLLASRITLLTGFPSTVEFILGMIKVIAVIGFIILGIVIDCGGAPVGGYIGAKYWHHPGAFTDFYGFCSVFTTAAFAFSGTEMAGLAAAEAKNPAKALPKACKQVFWRILIFYVLGTFIVGLIVPHDADYLRGASGSNTKASPFVVAIQNAGISGLPSVMNAVITISVISVANSATYGSSRTLQALSMRGMAPKWMAYIDKSGRPIYCILLQIAFGFLAFINEASSTGDAIFNWLLALSAVISFFVWGSICFAHIRFRQAWAFNGRDVKELVYTAPFGVIGSWIGVFLNVLVLIAVFYTSVKPLDAETFFENYLAVPLIIFFYVFWLVYTMINKDPKLERGAWLVKVRDMDILTNMRDDSLDYDLPAKVEYRTWGEYFKAAPLRIVRSLF
ncbi:amino-acid permease [Penicillium chermesinum]|uniref:Amino-acid permease n=1 Tax=Penicillium chermesinum TaxID=63820 RepID=A0A9W9PKD1_9EURO|nr:amino-acid permease [Penicillium chermesinum]KAJ5247303.1 amino-acid permease [Penicillium chermesinum]